MACLSIADISDIAVAAAALTGVWIAWQGLQTWKQQLRGTEDHDLARKILSSIIRFQDNFALLRSTQIPLGVSPGKAYEDRWAAFHQEASNLGVSLDEASILWGDKFSDLRNLLGQVVTQTRYAMEDFVIRRDDPQSPETVAAREAFFPQEGKVDSIGTSFVCLCEAIDQETRKRLLP